MIITGHQPNYLPYSGFFEKILRSDAFVIVDNVQFVKRGKFGWINRNKIRSNSGELWMTVPVLTKGKYTQSIIDTQINNDVQWNKKHWRSILLNYRNAGCFAEYIETFKDIYDRKWSSLAALNEEIIRRIINVLNIKVDIYKSSELGVSGKGTDLIIDMCEKLKASTYISGKHGKDYLDLGKSREKGVNVVFQDFVPHEYEQGGEGFIPYLSIIDLLFSCGKKGFYELAEKQENYIKGK